VEAGVDHELALPQEPEGEHQAEAEDELAQLPKPSQPVSDVSPILGWEALHEPIRGRGLLTFQTTPCGTGNLLDQYQLVDIADS
jgi:hypothetical protein